MKESEVVIPEETIEVRLAMRIAELEAERDRLRKALLALKKQYPLSPWTI
jgi:hypothetical protein